MSAALMLAAAALGLGPDIPLEEAPALPFPPAAPLLAPTIVLAPPAPGLPPTIRTMIEAAYKTGNDKTISDVVGLAKASFPDFIDAIEDVSAGQAKLLLTARREAQEREQARIAAASFLQIWKGELEAGGSRSTGTTRQLGVYAAAKLTRDGLRWRQKVNARLDYQQTDNETTTERWLAAWQPNYKFSDVLYAYGLGQYEHDKFLGYDSRGTLGVGIGYQLANRPSLNVTIEGGPAVRYTDFIEEGKRTTVAGRASLSARWALSPTLAFSQDASIFFEDGDATASSATSVETKLLGALKARLSYNVQFERDTLTTSRQLDTVTRATLVYGF